MEQKHRDFLNDLRRSGVTNMLGAGEYLGARFGLSRKEAGDILVGWMRTFDPKVDA